MENAVGRNFDSYSFALKGNGHILSSKTQISQADLQIYGLFYLLFSL